MLVSEYANHHAPRNIKEQKDIRTQNLLVLNFQIKRKSYKVKSEILKTNNNNNSY